MDIWSAAIVFLLSFLGLVLVIAVIFFLWLAYRYNISFSIQTKEKAEIDSQDGKRNGSGS